MLFLKQFLRRLDVAEMRVAEAEPQNQQDTYRLVKKLNYFYWIQESIGKNGNTKIMWQLKVEIYQDLIKVPIFSRFWLRVS